MALWFIRDRSQATSLMTDDQHMEEGRPASDAPENRAQSDLRAAIEALGGSYTEGQAGPRAGADAVSQDDLAEVWQLHEAAVEAEYRTHRFIGGGAARRQLHDALMAEAAVLQRLGYDSFATFAAANGWRRPDDAAGAQQTETDATMSRIRTLLGELGVEPG